MSSLTFLEKQILEGILGMESGYILDFTDRSFDAFFRDSVTINVRDDSFSKYGNSKANRMRFFWDNESDMIVGTALRGLLDYADFKGNAQDSKKIESARKIVYRLIGGADIESEKSATAFLDEEYESIDISHLPIEPVFTNVISTRLEELDKCIRKEISLASIFHTGSILEGLLLGIAQAYPKIFNQANCAPKDTKTNKVRPFQEWTLSNLIDVSCEIRLLTPDIQKFSHGLRDFRNYIHPFMQAVSGFQPDIQTAKICYQVLKAAISRMNFWHDSRKGSCT